MERPSYLTRYLFDWNLFSIVVGGQSALDSKFFAGQVVNLERVKAFLKGYGLDTDDPVVSAELFGNFQEALQFIRRYFLKEGNEQGLDLKIPNSLLMISDVTDLFLMSRAESDFSQEERLWAEVVLKVMHTILHADKDLRSNYFSIIQTQIFDRFYKHIFRGDEDQLYLGRPDQDGSIPLLDFETKSKKTRESVIIKLLHKPENVAEEVFDRIGLRFVTYKKIDTLRVINYLVEKNIVIPHNIKPSRSMNTMFDLNKYRDFHQQRVREAMRNDWDEKTFASKLESDLTECQIVANQNSMNKHSSKSYKSIQFTSRQLIKYRNPFIEQFSKVRKMAKNDGESDLAKKILAMDYSLVSRDIKFFFPYEVQIVDEKARDENTQGLASHQEYKKQQVLFAMKRVFGPLISYKKLDA